MNCPNCKKEKNKEVKMKLDGNFYECPQCNFAIRKNIKNIKWYKEICKDDEYWEKSAFERFPAVIAHEYFRIYDLLNNGQTYGAIFQIKDVFEVIIKLPILLYIAKKNLEEEKTTEDYKIILSILYKPLSLGDWKTILNNIYKVTSKDEFLYNVFKELRQLYNDSEFDIVKWRNETIGHGALRFDDNNEFINEIKEALIKIKKVFKKLNNIFESIQFFAYKKNKEKILLVGKDNAMDLTVENEVVYVNLGNKSSIKLNPFIVIKDSQFYFFDSFIKEKRKYDILSYPAGKKQSYIDENIERDIEKIFIKYNNIFNKENNEIILNCSVEEDVYLASCEEQLLEYQLDNSLEKIPYLEKWVKEKICDNEKEIFWLQMERGMGKTTFAQMVDKRAIGNIKIGNTISKVIYLNDTYTFDIKFVLQKLINLLCHDKDNKLIFYEKNTYNFNFDSEDKKREFAKLLNRYRDIYDKYYSNEKLLIIFDGLDEVNSNIYNNICDYIPLKEMLNERIYILLISRTEDEVEKLASMNNNITKDNKLIIKKDYDEYINILSKYLNKYFENPENSTIKEIIKKSDYRFFYVNIFVAVKKYFNNSNLNLLTDEKEIIKLYIEKLCFKYGKKYSRKLVRILYILATMKEALNLREISYLLGSEKITFEIIGYMSDLNNIIRIERTVSKGNVYSLSNSIVKEAVLDNYCFIKDELYNQWIGQLKCLRQEDENLTDDGITYLIANLLEYNSIQESNRLNEISSERFLLTIQELIGRLRLEHNQYKIERQIKMIKVLKEILSISKIDEHIKEFIYMYFYKESAEILYHEAKIRTDKVIELLNKSINSAYKIVESRYKKAIVNLIYENKIQIAVLNRNKEYRKTQLSHIEQAILNENIDVEILTNCMLYRELTNAYIDDGNYKIPLKYAKIQKKYYEQLIENARTSMERYDYKASLKRVDAQIVNIYIRNGICNNNTILQIEDMLKNIKNEAKKLDSISLDIDMLERINTEIAYSTYLTKLEGAYCFSKKDYECAFEKFNDVLEIYSYLDKIDYTYDNTHRIEAYFGMGNITLLKPEVVQLKPEYKKCIYYYNEIISFYNKDNTGFKSDPYEEFYIIFNTYMGIIKYYIKETEYINAIKNLIIMINLDVEYNMVIDEESIINFLKTIQLLVEQNPNNQLSDNLNKAHIYYRMNSREKAINIKKVFDIFNKNINKY